MRYIVAILFLFSTSVVFAQSPQCIRGIGHDLSPLYGLRDTTGLAYTFDTTTIEEKLYEWLIVPAGWDTLVYQCFRCDSIVYIPTDTIKMIARILPEESEWDDIVTTVNPFKTNRIVFAGNIKKLLFDYEFDYYRSFNVCYSKTDSYDDPTCDPSSDGVIIGILENKYYWLEIELKEYNTDVISVYDNEDPGNPILLQTINITYEE